MATRYFVNGGVNNNFSSITNWSTTSGGATGSSVPTLNDDAIFDGNSPNCTVDVASAVGNLYFVGVTNYTNTITMNSNITVGRNSAFSGDVTLASGFTDANVAGTGRLIINVAGSSPDLTSNGGIWNAGLEVDAAITITLAGNWTVNNFTKGGVGTTTLNANTLNVRGDILVSQILTGTTTIVANGTGLQSITTTTRLDNSLTINKTSGTFSQSGDFIFGGTSGRTLTWTAGTMSFPNSNARLIIYTGTFDTKTVVWPNIYLEANTQTYTITGDMICGGTFTAGGAVTFASGGTVSIYGDVLHQATVAKSGTGAKFVIAGTGSQNWTGGNLTVFNNSIDINKPSGTFSWNARTSFNTSTLTYISGGCDLTNASFTTTTVTPAAIFDLKGLTVGTFSALAGGTQQLTSTCSVVDVLCGASTHNGATMSILGNITMAGNVSGTAPFNFIGTGTFIGGGSSVNFTPAFICDTDGTLSLSGTLTVSTRTWTYLKGNFNPLPGSLFRINGSYTIVSNGNTFGNVEIIGSIPTITFTGDFRCKLLTQSATNILTISNANLYCESVLISGGATIAASGTTFIFYGDGYYQNSQVLRGLSNVRIDCTRLRLIGQVAFVGGTNRYVKGEVITDGSIVHFNTGDSTLIDFHKIPFDRIKFRTRTLTMNEFFCGTPERKVKFLTDQATAQTLTINFQDNFPKFARFVDFSSIYFLSTSSINFPRRGQLTLLTDGRKSFSRITGVKYINSLGNGTLTEKALTDVYVPKEPTTFIADPAFNKY